MFDIDKYSECKVYLRDDDGLSVTGREIKAVNQAFKRSMENKELVVCLSDNSASSILVYLLCISNGVPIMLLDSSTDEASLRNILEVYAPTTIAGRDIKSEESVLSFGLESFAASANPKETIHHDLALLLSTSGSTGSKKFVRISKSALKANTDSIMDYLPISHNDVAITTLPMAYTYGLSIINTHFKAGAQIVATKYSALQREFWNLFADAGVTNIAGVPYSYEIMIKSGLLRRDLPTLRYMTQAGGHLERKYKEILMEYCTRKNINFYAMYGQTEATSRMSYVPPQQLAQKVDSIGVPISGGRFELADPHQKESGEIGEIVYYGPNVSMGYAESRADLSKGDENKGKLYTGDLGRVDEDGFWYVVGRKKRFSKVFGVRISLVEIERLVKRLSSLDDVMAIEQDGKIQIKYVGVADEASLKKSLSTATKVHPSAFKLIAVAALPRNESGKLIYK